MSKKNVVVIFGGQSSEHDISCISVQTIAKAIRPEKYEVTYIGITKEGHWLLVDSLASIEDGSWRQSTTSAVLSPDATRKELILTGADGYSTKRVDVIFPVMHGMYGEDGTIQGLFEMAKLPYVGCGVLASAVGMDKVYTKIIVDDLGISQADYVLVRAEEVFMAEKSTDREEGINEQWEIVKNDKDVNKQEITDNDKGINRQQDIADKDTNRQSGMSGDKYTDKKSITMDELVVRVENKLSYPVFIKPSKAGSSQGVSKAHDRAELIAGLKTAARHDTKILVERNIIGREIECAVLGSAVVPDASGVGEILAAAEFYDFDAKYSNAESKTIISPELPEGKAEEIREAAKAIFSAVDGYGLARVDFFLEKETNRVIFNEINTLPGFTSISMYPMLWKAAGLSIEEQVEKQIEMAFERRY